MNGGKYLMSVYDYYLCVVTVYLRLTISSEKVIIKIPITTIVAESDASVQ